MLSQPMQRKIEPEPSEVDVVRAAIEALRHKFLRRQSLNWDDLQTKALAQMKSGKKASAVILDIINTLGEKHSGYLPAASLKSGSTPEKVQAAGEWLQQERVAMVKVPGFFGLDSEQGKRYATEIQEIIGRLDKNQPDGWIVDLRENNGGNLWPMLAGLGPLLGAETVGGVKTPGSDEVEKWKYKDGKSSIGSMLTCESNHVHAPIGAHVPIAVLTGPMTSSAGEALVIAFSGRSNTRTFGRETLGVPFANKTYILPDGSQLLVSAQYLVNRDGKVVENGTIKPDEQVEDSRIIASASQWINDNSPLSLNTTFFER